MALFVFLRKEIFVPECPAAGLSSCPRWIGTCPGCSGDFLFLPLFVLLPLCLSLFCALFYCFFLLFPPLSSPLLLCSSSPVSLQPFFFFFYILSLYYLFRTMNSTFCLLNSIKKTVNSRLFLPHIKMYSYICI